MSTSRPPLVFVTGSDHKVREVQAVLGRPVVKHDLGDAFDEVQGDPAYIVARKARDALKLVRPPFIVEDSSLPLDAWNGLPGPYIKHFYKAVGSEGIARLADRDPRRLATARTDIVYVDAACDLCPFVGELRVTIAQHPRGTTGFAVDDIMVPLGQDRTFAEMTAAEKDAISHRAKAALALKAFLDLYDL